jgi:chromosome partitioning protein
MTVVALLGRKGGSGKSTLSTNIAAWCAREGHQVMLGDVDRQQSVRSWLQRRSPQDAKVNTWAVDNGKVFRAPPGTTHVILDTPGGLYDHELAKLVVWVDAIVVPIGPSIFDRDASLDFLKELNKLPKVASGRCKVAAVGMRWPMDRVQLWHQHGKVWDTDLLTVIPDSAQYRNCLETGSSVFDDPSTLDPSEIFYWQPLLQWLESAWKSNAPVAAAPNRFLTQRLQTAASQMQARPVVTTPSCQRLPSANITSPVYARQLVTSTPRSTVAAISTAAISPERAWVPKWLRSA